MLELLRDLPKEATHPDPGYSPPVNVYCLLTIAKTKTKTHLGLKMNPSRLMFEFSMYSWHVLNKFLVLTIHRSTQTTTVFKHVKVLKGTLDGE